MQMIWVSYFKSKKLNNDEIPKLKKNGFKNISCLFTMHDSPPINKNWAEPFLETARQEKARSKSTVY